MADPHRRRLDRSPQLLRLKNRREQISTAAV
jgi:hypothetical protein